MNSSLTKDGAERFGGVARLYGQQALKIFQQAHVAVVGLGGVGSWIAESLARSGIGCLTLMDLDDICLTNTNRQIHTTSQSIGQAKITAMAQRLQAINPDLEVCALHAFYTESTSPGFFNNSYSVIVDAIDSVRHKAHLITTARAHNIPIVTVGGAGGKIDPTRICVADLSQSKGDRLLMLVRKKLRSQFAFPRHGKGKFKVPCVFSDELPRFPAPDGSVCLAREPGSPAGLNCDSGLGSVTHLTATMGLFAASCTLNLLAQKTEALRSL